MSTGGYGWVRTGRKEMGSGLPPPSHQLCFSPECFRSGLWATPSQAAQASFFSRVQKVSENSLFTGDGLGLEIKAQCNSVPRLVSASLILGQQPDHKNTVYNRNPVMLLWSQFNCFEEIIGEPHNNRSMRVPPDPKLIPNSPRCRCHIPVQYRIQLETGRKGWHSPREMGPHLLLDRDLWFY